MEIRGCSRDRGGQWTHNGGETGDVATYQKEREIGGNNGVDIGNGQSRPMERVVLATVEFLGAGDQIQKCDGPRSLRH